MTVGELKEKLNKVDDNKKIFVTEDCALVPLGTVYIDKDGDVILEQ